MGDTRQRKGRRRAVLLGAVVFGLAFGFVEAAVVIYLRRLYYPEGFGFPLRFVPTDIGAVEAAREIATIVMLAAVAFMGSRSRWGRFGLFAVSFGVWDLVYYAGLRLVLRWPASLAAWDVLFLVPGIWTGPVWAPMLVSSLLILCGAVLFLRGDAGRLVRPAALHWTLALLSIVAIVGAFLANHGPVYRGEPPGRFPAVVFLSGVALGLASFWNLVRVSSGAGRR